MGERDVLLEEIHDLRNQLQYYTDSSPAKQRKSLLLLTYPSERSSSSPPNTILEPMEENLMQKLEHERTQWEEAETKWISLAEEMKAELESTRSHAEQLKQELEVEKKCAEELKEAMQLAMQGHARMLEQYADLEEKHMQMLANQRKIHEGIDDVKRAAARAGVKGAESKFINALAAEIAALKVEREKERRYWREENKMLQAQLRDTAEAVQAAGELLVRLKEAEEAVAAAEVSKTRWSMSGPIQNLLNSDPSLLSLFPPPPQKILLHECRFALMAPWVLLSSAKSGRSDMLYRLQIENFLGQLSSFVFQ